MIFFDKKVPIFFHIWYDKNSILFYISHKIKEEKTKEKFMSIDIIFIMIGFIALIIGADVLVRGASQIAKRFSIPDVLIGLTIVCIGTSLPELIITITSALKGYPDLIVGNAIGSNLCNLLLILGFISLMKPTKIEKEIQNIHLPVAILGTIFVLLLANGMLGTGKFIISRFDGVILLLIFIIYFSYPIITAVKDIIKSKDKKTETIQGQKKSRSVLISIIFIIIGAVFLKYGGDLVVDHSVSIATMLGISERVIGLTIVAVGTALPELVTSIIAVIKNNSGLAIGNLIGSCILNLCLILGVGAVITPLVFSAEFNMSLLLLIAVTFLVWIFNYIGEKSTISRVQGAMMFIVFILYIIKLFIS